MDRQLNFSYLVGQLSSVNATPQLVVTSEAMVELWEANIRGLNAKLVEMLKLISQHVAEFNMSHPKEVVDRKKVSR